MPKSLPSQARRLSDLVHRPGGMTVNEAVSAAEARLDVIRDSSLKELAAMVDHMLSLGEEIATVPSIAAFDALYSASNTVVGVAGVFGLPELGKVAFSLCTLLDRQRSLPAWNMQAIQLHLDSLRVMSGDEDNERKQAVIKALHQVVDRLAATSGAVAR